MIVMLTAKGNKYEIDYTDIDGMLVFPHDCVLGDRLFAVPRSKIYYQSEAVGCKSEIVLLVTRHYFVAGSESERSTKIPPVPDLRRTPSDARVIGYKHEIVLLQADVEAKKPGWIPYVRERGVMLAHLIGEASEDQLNPSRRIIQHEYKGWALLMVADTFSEESTGKEKNRRQRRIEFATSALREFDLALDRMGEVGRGFTTGDTDAAAVYEWMTGDSADLGRTHYLKAIALAVIARAGGAHTKAEVQQELASLPAEYLNRYPAKNNPDLAWAIKP